MWLKFWLLGALLSFWISTGLSLDFEHCCINFTIATTDIIVISNAKIKVAILKDFKVLYVVSGTGKYVSFDLPEGSTSRTLTGAKFMLPGLNELSIVFA